MASNAQKTPLARSINKAAQRRVADAIAELGKSLPSRVVAVSGSIVTVAFEVVSQYTLPTVTCPMFGPEYIRYPTQVGDLGIVISADAYIAGITGLGPGTADLLLQANLSMLVWMPIASTKWSASENSNALVLYGPDGSILRDSGKTTKVQVDGAGNVQIWGATSLSTDVGGYGERLTEISPGVFNSETWHTGATINTIPDYGFNPPEIPPP